MARALLSRGLMRHSSVLLVASFVLLAGASGCARRVRVETPATVAVAQPAPQYFQPAPTTILLAQPQHPQIVRAAVIQALGDLGYRLEGEDGQRIVANYSRGRDAVRIQVEYWPTQATVSYLGSTGLRFRRDGTSPHYERWMANLQRAIPNHVAVLARQQAYPGQVIIVQGAPTGAPPPATVVAQPAPSAVVVQPAPTATIQGTVVVSP